MPNKLFWLPLPVDRWLGELAGGLRAEQEGALVRLAATSWLQTPPCTLPNDARYLASKSGLGSQWARLSPAILAHFQPTADGTRLELTWLRQIYDEQLRRYELRKNRNKRHRDAQHTETIGETPPETHRKTSRSTSPTASQPASQNGAGDVSLSRAKNLELRSSTELPNGSSSTAAPKARASADAARAAPGARVEESPYSPSDDSDPGRAVDTRRGGGPENVSDVLQQLRPPGAVLRPSVAKERELAIAWAHEHPDEATRVELELHDDVLWQKAKPKQRDSMLVSAFVKAMNANGGNPATEHAEVSP